MNKTLKLLTVLCMATAVISLAGCSVSTGPKELTDYAVEGGYYTGTCTDGKATGVGTIEYDNGNIYEGPVVNGLPQGDGVMIDIITEGTYTGSFENGKYSDTDAVFEFDNGGIYTGAFENGKIKGAGVFTWPDSSRFEGTFSGAAGKAGSAGSLDATGVLAFVGGINFTGTIVEGAPNVGSFAWPNDGPIYEGTFSSFLTGYGDLDMRNGITYYGPMGGGLLVPNNAWLEKGDNVTIEYPSNDTYAGETFVGNYYYSSSNNKDELVGIVTSAGGATEYVKIKTDFTFGYSILTKDSYDAYLAGERPTDPEGEVLIDGTVKYIGEVANGKPVGVGIYIWNGTYPRYSVTNGNGWLTGVGTLDMGNGIVYVGPMNAGVLAPYTEGETTYNTVNVTYPNGIFTGTLTPINNASISAFYGAASYFSFGSFEDTINKVTIDAYFAANFEFSIYPVLHTAANTPIWVDNLPYEGQYIVIGDINYAVGQGEFRWDVANAIPRIEAQLLVFNSAGIVKFYQDLGSYSYVYEGGMTLDMTLSMAFGVECGVTAATVTFGNGDVFVGEWINGVLTGTMTYSAGGTKAGTMAVGLVSCVFTEAQ